MFKLLKTFLEPQANSESSNSDQKLVVEEHDPFESQLKQANNFRQEGKLKEAITIYRQTIEQASNLSTIPAKLSIALQYNHNLSLAYEQLAVAYKQKGEVEQAANFYRQAIILKSLNCQRIKQPHQSNAQTQIKPIIKKNDLLNAFTFQPLSAENQLIRLAGQNHQHLFSEQTNSINFQQTISVEWETAQVYLQQALDNCDRQLWQQAASACQQAIKLSPNLAEAYKIWGNALQRMGKTTEAMDCYSKAVEIQPDLAEVYAKVANLYLGQNKWQQAIDYYQKAIIIKPNFAEAYRSLAQIWQQLNQPEKAQVYHSKSLELESLRQQTQTNILEPILPATNLLSQSVVQYQTIAKNLEQQNKWQEAAHYYRQALELNLSQFQSLSNEQPIVNSIDNDLNNSEFNRLKQIQQLLQPTSEDETNYTTVTTEKVQSRTKQTNKAIERYQKQAQLQPDCAKIQLDLGNLYAKQQQWQTAINCYDKAIKIDYQCAEAYWNLADVLEKIGNIAESLERRYQALNFKADLASASEHTTLGDSLQQQGNIEQAVICYRRAIGLQPQFMLAYRRLAQILSDQGKTKEAIACYRQAVEYAPHNAEFYFLFAQALAEEKQWHQAVRAYRRVLELQPTYPQASYRLNHALAEKLKLDLKNNS